jgi:hypothetical protein
MDKILGIFNYLDIIDNKNKLFYLTAFAIIIYLSTQFITPTNFIGILIGLSFIIFSQDKQISQKSDLNRELELKLQLLDKNIPLYFHIDPDMINLFFSIKDFKQFNPQAFVQTMKTTDNVLHLKTDFEKTLHNPVETFELAQIMSQKSLNYMQSFIISLPTSKVTNTKFQYVLERHHILLKRNMDYMFERCKELTTDINISTKFITDYNQQKPHNPSIFKFGTSNFDLYN